MKILATLYFFSLSCFGIWKVLVGIFGVKSGQGEAWMVILSPLVTYVLIHVFVLILALLNGAAHEIARKLKKI